MNGTEQQLHCFRRSGNYKLSWSIIKKAHAYKGGGKGKCNLCLTEKARNSEESETKRMLKQQNRAT